MNLTVYWEYSLPLPYLDKLSDLIAMQTELRLVRGSNFHPNQSMFLIIMLEMIVTFRNCLSPCCRTISIRMGRLSVNCCFPVSSSGLSSRRFR